MQLTQKLTPESFEEPDDLPIGRVLSRREILALLAGAGATVLLVGCTPQQSTPVPATSAPASTAAGATPPNTTIAATGATTTAIQTTAANTSPAAVTAAIQTTADSPTTTAATTTAASVALPTCVVVPELTEGPYFVDEKLNRSGVRTDTNTKAVKEGVPLRLVFNVSQVSSGACTAYAGAYVDIWHCDALGNYSDVQQNNTMGQNFLRGYQVTSASGKAEFTTIYPGWYQGRAVHIHFKVRNALDTTKSHTFTSQLFFDDTLNQQVFTLAPYKSKGQSTTKNANDSIYRSGGASLLLNPVKEGDGYIATFNIGLSIA